MVLFRLSRTPLKPDALRRRLSGKDAGGFVCFEGRVRGRNRGRIVRLLEYEAHDRLARIEGGRVVAAAERKFGLKAAVCLHRVGRLRAGEVAVWAGVLADHRAAAFDACRYIIDEVKARVPIWKKEHYAHGVAEWITPAKSLGANPGVARKRKTARKRNSARNATAPA
jgi:molybdopterin synthase catalytic subunit